MGTVWLLTLVLACSAEVGLGEGSRDKRPASSEATELPESDGGGWNVCDHQEYTLLNGQKIRLPALCNPNADQIWDPPPDREQTAKVQVLPPPADLKAR